MQALARTEPKVSKAQLLFDMAYEKYRGRDVRAALKLYEKFLAEYPDHELVREALFRTDFLAYRAALIQFKQDQETEARDQEAEEDTE